jgi:hypothetical protein
MARLWTSFEGPRESGRGRRPVIFDIVAPDRVTSLLSAIAPDLRLVLHVNPSTMSFSYSKNIQRSQTRGGWVEFHWGDAAEEINFDAATGGFMRLYSGLSNITGHGGGSPSRRDTLSYDKYLDILALFHNNGAVYDRNGNIVSQGYIKIEFDGGIHIGWFDGQFSVTEDAGSPYQFRMSARFIIDQEIMAFNTNNLSSGSVSTSQSSSQFGPTVTQVEENNTPSWVQGRIASAIESGDVALTAALGGAADKLAEAAENASRIARGLLPQSASQFEADDQQEAQEGVDATPSVRVIEEAGQVEGSSEVDAGADPLPLPTPQVEVFEDEEVIGSLGPNEAPPTTTIEVFDEGDDVFGSP